MHYQLPSAYTDSDNAPGDKFQLLQQTVDLTFPLSFNTTHGDAYIISGVFYNHFLFDAVGGDVDIPAERFHRMTFKAGVSYPWNGRHRTTAVFLPTWATQDVIFGPDGFQAGFLGVHHIKFSDRFTLRLGLYYNREFYGNFFMPLAGVDWKLNNDWYVFGLLPGTANVYKRVNDWFAFSFSERAPNGSLLFSDGSGDLVGVGRGIFALFMFDLHFTPFTFDLMGNDSDLTFSLSFGHSVFRKYLAYDASDNEIGRGVFYESKDGPYVKFTTAMRLWPDN